MTAVLLRLAIMVKGWTHLHWAALALSYVLWLVLQLYSTSRDFLAVNFTELHAVPVFWLMLLLIPIASVVLDSGIVGRNALFATPDYRIINEEWAVECDRNKYVDPETGEVVNAVPQQSEVWDSMADLGSQEIALPPSASAMDAPLNESDASAGGGNGLPLSADGAAVWIELAQPPVSPRSLAREIHWPIGDKSPS